MRGDEQQGAGHAGSAPWSPAREGHGAESAIGERHLPDAYRVSDAGRPSRTHVPPASVATIGARTAWRTPCYATFSIGFHMTHTNLPQPTAAAPLVSIVIPAFNKWE